ncbi:MAG TPA: nucleotidyltransferase domain-containing protein [Gemmatimonadales bacterium]|nr:nucleotidyltransferase domain-containing protein [Gemmatimonadales bacterium]
MRSGVVPELHATFLRNAIERLEQDSRIVGVAAGGSYASHSMDEFSDLDLVIAVEATAYETVLRERRKIAGDLGTLLAAFTGEHVDEPRLLICLYGPLPRLLHVDLKFVTLVDLAVRVENPTVLWERDGRVTTALRVGEARYPTPDLQWIEDRFWTWVHYAASKVGRGELFEAIDFLGFLRSRVLGPLALAASGAAPSGVRKLEASAPRYLSAMQATIAGYAPSSCVAALRASVDLYRALRATLAPGAVRVNSEAEAAAVAYLADITARQ